MYKTVSVLLFVSMQTMPIHTLGVLVDNEMVSCITCPSAHVVSGLESEVA